MIFKEINKYKIEISTETGGIIGFLEPSDDGFFYFWQEKSGYYPAYLLREIADKLDEINQPWDDEIAKYFEAQAKLSKNDQ